MENLTEVSVEFMKKHGPTRWLGMKLVGVRALEQLPNVKEYFLKFLPNQKGFKTSERYERIVSQLKNPLIDPYLSFMIFVSQDFEKFLKVFQYEQPMIHVLWLKIVEFLRSLMTKFIARKNLQNEGTPVKDEQVLEINVIDQKNCKKEVLVDVGTRAKLFFSNNDLLKDDAELKFRRECLKFYKISTKYLLEHLPHRNKIIQYAQYLHPLKRTETQSTSVISNSALRITQFSFYNKNTINLAF